MSNSVQILNPTTGTYYTVTVTVESAISLDDETGQESYYIRVSTAEKDAEGNAIPDQILTTFGTDTYTTIVSNAIHKITDLVGDTGPSDFSSSSTRNSSSSSSSTRNSSSSTSSTINSSSSESSTRNSSSSSSDSTGYPLVLHADSGFSNPNVSGSTFNYNGIVNGKSAYINHYNCVLIYDNAFGPFQYLVVDPDDTVLFYNNSNHPKGAYQPSPDGEGVGVVS